MILTSLRISNFRQYRGLHELTFATDTSTNVTVITGPNGAGKTNLFLALNWCLYGRGMEGKGQVLTKGLSADEHVRGGFVEVHFRHDGLRYVARREVTGVSAEVEGQSELSLLELGTGGRTVEIRNPTLKMNEILPSDARQYFFFDGERIDEMSRPGHEEQVREAVRGVLKLGVLERAVSHLSDVTKDFGTAVRRSVDLDERTRELIERADLLRSELDDLRSRRDTASLGQEATKRELDELNAQLLGAASVRDLAGRRRVREQAVASAEEQRSAILRDIEDAVIRSAPGVAREAVDAAAAILEEKREKGQIPSNVRGQLIDDLLGARVCLCGRALDDTSEQALRAHRKGAVSPLVENVVLQTSALVGALLRSADEVPIKLSQDLRKLSILHRDMEDMQREIDGISAQISEVGALAGDDADRMEESRRANENRLNDLKWELGRLERETELKEEELSAAQEQMQRAGTQTLAGHRAKRRYELAARASDAARTLLERFSGDMRGRIEAEADTLFKTLVWKDKHFDHVRILDDYELDVIDRHGRSALRELSAGERQVLSLAFIAAISRVTGEEAPLVIDTPFGRISEEPLHNISGTLPDVASQIVLFVTDRELDPVARAALAPRIGSEASLRFDDETGYTAIEVSAR